MKNEFVPYDIALAMKELGFDEECTAVYFGEYEERDFDNGIALEYRQSQYYAQKGWSKGLLAPLYQQAFRWFREKHGIGGYVRRGSIKMHEHLKENGFVVADYEWRINKTDGTHTWGHGMEDTYEEAELAYLRKLIEEVQL